MKALALLIAFLLLASAGRGDPSPASERWLIVPGAIPFNEVMRSHSTISIPDALRRALAISDWRTTNSTVPAELEGFTFDLNSDGEPEYFIYNPVASGTGGPAYLIFARFADEWRCIHTFQGSLHAFPQRKGWPRLVTISRGGSDTFTKSYAMFAGTCYRDTLLEHYDDGTITRTVPSAGDGAP
jgi:hypothetical protein